MRKLLVFLIVIGALYFAFGRNESKPAPPSISSSTATPSDPDADTQPTHSPASSSEWGSGHQAGYDWAQEKNIDNDEDCEAAGEHSNSPSFAEGCKQYVEENR